MPARLGDCAPKANVVLRQARRRRGAVTARSPPHPMLWGVSWSGAWPGTCTCSTRGHIRQRSRTHVHVPDPALNDPAAAWPMTPPVRPWGTPAAGHDPIGQWGTGPTPPEPKPKRGGRILVAAAIGVVLLVATGCVANAAPPTPSPTPARLPRFPTEDPKPGAASGAGAGGSRGPRAERHDSGRGQADPGRPWAGGDD